VEDDRGLRLPPYSAIGETFYSLSARWEATLRLPARLRAATTGAVVSDRVRGAHRTVRVATGQARDFALAIGRLGVTSTRVDGVRIRVFTRMGPGVVRGASRDARRAVTTFGRRYGPYGSSELDLVVVPFRYGGMEYPELIFAYPSRVAIVHEIAHQWWYGLVGDDQSREPWLDESFATFSHERLLPNSNLCDPARPYSLVNPKWDHIPLDSSMALFDRSPESAIGEVIYSAGSCALQRLERDIGRARMTAFFRLLQTRFRFGVMRTSDVLDAIREVAPSYDLARWQRLAHLSH
jgi:aminopeptidase N